MRTLDFSVVVFAEGKGYTSWCPELDVASQGNTVDGAVKNIREALELHLECLSPSELKEIKKRQGTRLITTLEVPAPA